MEKTEVTVIKKRDFSEIINATFSFLSQEIKPLAKVIVWYAGIPIILSSIIAAFYSGNEIVGLFAGLESGVVTNQPFPTIGLLLLSTLLSFISYIFLLGLSASYVSLYAEKGKGNFSAHDVWEKFTPYFWQLVGLHLVIVLLVVVMAMVVGGTTFVIGLSGSGVGVGVITALLIIALIVALFYVMVPFSLAYMVLFNEQQGISNAISRSFKLVHGKWWVSFGVVIVLGVIVSILGFVFSAPAMIIGAVQGFIIATGEGSFDGQSLPIILTTILGGLGQYIVYPILLMGLGFQYFNLREQKENPGLFQKVADIANEDY